MKDFSVTLYHFDEAVEIEFDRASLPLTRLFSGVIEATDEKFAAARAWIDNVGTHRWEKLDAMQAPPYIRSWQVDPKALGDELVETSIWQEGITFLLDNRVETWLISVLEVEQGCDE
jgi:hypothetical protein